LTRLVSLAAVAAMASAGPALLATPAQAAGAPPQFYSNGKPLTTTPVPVTLWGEVTLTGGPTCHDVMSASVWNEGGQGVGQIEGFATSGCHELYWEKCALAICPLSGFETGELPFVVEKREAEVCSDILKTELSECRGIGERTVEILTLRLRRRIGLPWRLRLVRAVEEEEAAILAEIGVPSAGETCYPREVVEGKEVAAQWEKVPPGCIRLNVIVPKVPSETMIYGTLKPRLVNGAGNGLDTSHLELGPEAGQLTTTGEAKPEIGSQGQIKLTGSEARELITAR
jgi:hypothetical protein